MRPWAKKGMRSSRDLIVRVFSVLKIVAHRKSWTREMKYSMMKYGLRSIFQAIGSHILCTYWLTRRAGWEHIWLEVMAYWPNTPLYQLYRYVLPQRVWFLSRFGLKTGIGIDHYNNNNNLYTGSSLHKKWYSVRPSETIKRNDNEIGNH